MSLNDAHGCGFPLGVFIETVGSVMKEPHTFSPGAFLSPPAHAHACRSVVLLSVNERGASGLYVWKEQW